MPTFEPEFSFLLDVGRISVFPSVEILVDREPISFPRWFDVLGFGGLGGQEGALLGRCTDRRLLCFFATWRRYC